MRCSINSDSRIEEKVKKKIKKKIPVPSQQLISASERWLEKARSEAVKRCQALEQDFLNLSPEVRQRTDKPRPIRSTPQTEAELLAPVTHKLPPLDDDDCDDQGNPVAQRTSGNWRYVPDSDQPLFVSDTASVCKLCSKLHGHEYKCAQAYSSIFP